MPPSTNGHRWVLAMIVKNESKTLPRLWDSIKHIVDGWVICDTGSTDTTLEFLEDLKQNSPVPGNYYKQPWKNFGYNRSLSFTTAVDWAKSEQPTWDLSKTWALLLDADMVLHVENKLIDPKELIYKLDMFHDEVRGWEFEQRQGGMHYKNIRVLRLDSPWNCIGKTHEYWNYDAPHDYYKMMRLVPTNILYIDDRGDGGARGDKFERDERLLREQLEETPNDSRTLFYLGQTLQDLGKWQEAHDIYMKRVEVGGWEEERWMAAMRAANCSYDGSKDKKLSDQERDKLWSQCVQESVAAWSMRTHRAESIYRLAYWCRLRGKNLEAWAWIQLGRTVCDPKDDKLFVEPHAYSDGWWDEISINAYYVRNKIPNAEKEAVDALEKLLLRRYKGNIESVAHRRRDMARSNRRFYPFPTLYKNKELIYQGEWTPTKNEWNACNPSIVRNPNGTGFIAAVRNVNYKIVNGSYVYPPNQEQCIDTATQLKLFHIEKDTATDLVEVREKSLGWIPEVSQEDRDKMRDEWKRVGRIPVWGFEDVRLFTHENEVWFTSTCLHVEGHFGTPRIILGKLNNTNSGVEKWTPLRVFRKEEELKGWYGNGCEKNWLPFSHDGKIKAVYSWEPMRIIEINPETGTCIISQENQTYLDLGAWRGSTCPVLMKAGDKTPSFAEVSPAFYPVKDHEKRERFGCMIHEIIGVSGKDVARNYYQRWVEFRMTPKLEIVYVSEQFVMTDTTIEFPLGCVQTEEKDWVISFGHKDGRARWCLYHG